MTRINQRRKCSFAIKMRKCVAIDGGVLCFHLSPSTAKKRTKEVVPFLVNVRRCRCTELPFRSFCHTPNVRLVMVSVLSFRWLVGVLDAGIPLLCVSLFAIHMLIRIQHSSRFNSRLHVRAHFNAIAS